MSATPAGPRVLAIVLNWRSETAARASGDAVLASRGVAADVLFVDNGSDDGSPDALASRFGAARVLRLSSNRGYAGGMNAGIEHWLSNTDAEWAVVLTSDTVLAADALADMLDVAAEEGVGLVGPLVLYGGEERVFSAGGTVDPRHARVAHHRAARDRKPYDTDWVDGCCMLIRRSVAEAVGGFDERFFIYFEEIDLCCRVRAAGWSVRVAPAARAWQEKPDLPGARYFYYMNRNRYIFWRKNFDIGFGRVSAELVRETVRLLGWTALALLRPRLWPEAPLRLRHAGRQLRGATLGIRDVLRGRDGWSSAVS